MNPFAIPLALAYINFHVFGNLVLGEKYFCKLGEEWIPANMRTGITAKAFKGLAKKIGLLEKIVLIFLDFVALIALLTILSILVLIGSVVAGNFDVIIKMGWSVIKLIFTLFDANIKL